MKWNTLLGLVGLSLIWVPASHSMTNQSALLPIVFLHGLSQKGKDMKDSVAILRKHVGEEVKIYTPDITEGSFPSWEKVIPDIANTINSLPGLEKGFNALGYSKGGVDFRFLIESGLLEKPARSLITIASPQRGICGFPYQWDDQIDTIADSLICCCTCRPCSSIEKKLHGITNSQQAQRVAPVLTLWNKYGQEEDNVYLGCFNNVIEDHNQNPNYDAYQHNLGTVRKFVVLSAAEDHTVEPPQSSIFNYVKQNHTTPTDLVESKIYTNLALNVLAAKEVFKRQNIAKQGHGSIRLDETTFINEIIPNLSRESDCTTSIHYIKTTGINNKLLYDTK